jgi:hypothetical protein
MTRRIVIVAILGIALVGASLFVHDRLRPKSDRERIEQACGPHALESNTEPEPAIIGDDGTICCGGLCGMTQSA